MQHESADRREDMSARRVKEGRVGVCRMQLGQCVLGVEQEAALGAGRSVLALRWEMEGS